MCWHFPLSPGFHFEGWFTMMDFFAAFENKCNPGICPQIPLLCLLSRHSDAQGRGVTPGGGWPLWVLMQSVPRWRLPPGPRLPSGLHGAWEGPSGAPGALGRIADMYGTGTGCLG